MVHVHCSAHPESHVKVTDRFYLYSYILFLGNLSLQDPERTVEENSSSDSDDGKDEDAEDSSSSGSPDDESVSDIFETTQVGIWMCPSGICAFFSTSRILVRST